MSDSSLASDEVAVKGVGFSRTALKTTSIVLSSIALTSVLARTVIRIRLQKRLFVDDAFQYIGVICLCASVGLLWRFSQGIFAGATTVRFDYDYSDSGIIIFPDLDHIGGVYMILTYITIYFVKLGFLFFFRILVRRDRKMTIYWWTVFTIIIVTLLVSIGITVVPLCWIFRTSLVECSDKNGFRLATFLGLSALGTVLDVITDILLLIIPFVQLWRVKTSFRQKFILCITFSLSVFMIVIAIIRISHIRSAAGGIGFMWMTFWHQVEASTAVIMLSFSAFRSLFVARESRFRADRNRHLHWYMSRKNRMAAAARRFRKLHSESEVAMNDLPEIPRATMTGMSTFLRAKETNK